MDESLPLEIEGFILLGGASSRMGRDKARLELDGKQFVERIAGALSSIATRISMVGGSRSSAVSHFPTIEDIYPKLGALGGVHSALASCQAKWAAIVACDLPFVTGELFVRLAALSENFDCVVPIQDDGRLQPLCALYRSTACFPAAQELIETGELRPRRLFERLNTRLVSINELSALPDSQLFFMNINTPADYEQAKKAVTSDKAGELHIACPRSL